MWDGERIGRRKKKRAHGGRWEGEREEARPLPPPPPHLFFLPIVPGALSFFRELKPRVK